MPRVWVEVGGEDVRSERGWLQAGERYLVSPAEAERLCAEYDVTLDTGDICGADLSDGGRCTREAEDLCWQHREDDD